MRIKWEGIKKADLSVVYDNGEELHFDLGNGLLGAILGVIDEDTAEVERKVFDLCKSLEMSDSDTFALNAYWQAFTTLVDSNQSKLNYTAKILADKLPTAKNKLAYARAIMDEQLVQYINWKTKKEL